MLRREAAPLFQAGRRISPLALITPASSVSHLAPHPPLQRCASISPATPQSSRKPPPATSYQSRSKPRAKQGSSRSPQWECCRQAHLPRTGIRPSQSKPHQTCGTPPHTPPVFFPQRDLAGYANARRSPLPPRIPLPLGKVARPPLATPSPPCP